MNDAPATTLLTLHAVRLLGFASTSQIAARYSVESYAAEETLLDLEAVGEVTRSEFGGLSGWSLTDRGRTHNEQLLAAELDAAGARHDLAAALERFVPMNARFLDAATSWQIRPSAGAPMASNDHTDHAWDDQVLRDLASAGRRLARLQPDLTTALPRLDGYAGRYATALARAESGEHRWVDGIGIDSCHTVWMQLHEDLLATLGITR